MQRYIYVLFLSSLMTLFACTTNSGSAKEEVAVIVPLQHPAMDAIVGGLREALGDAAELRVYQAQGDATLQAAILRQLAVRGTRIVVPIGTAATQMAIAQLPGCDIVHLAAKFEEADRQPGQRVCGVLDELAPESSIDLARALLPSLRKLTVIHSPADKIYPELGALEARAAECGIAVQRLMLQQQSELYTMGQQVAKDSELLLVLKDHMVVSGIATLKELAVSRGIPLLASDEGSVSGGASFAAGVPEAAIGRAGAALIQDLLAGRHADELAIERVDEVHLFYRMPEASGFAVREVADRLDYLAEELS